MLDDAIALLEKFKLYKSENPSGSLSDFGRHLSMAEEKAPENASWDEMSAKMPFPVKADSVDEYIGWLWGRLIRFTGIWEKKALKNTPLANSAEFGVLMFTFSHQKPSKSELAKQSLMENSTTFEVIKRLIKKGLISEVHDERDKRTKLLLMTEKGKAVIFQTLRKVVELSHHVTGDLTVEEKKILFEVLLKLNDFHTKSFKAHKESDWGEVIK